MATRGLAGKASAAAQPDVSSGLRYVARQPIMDKRASLHAYELLFRAGPEAGYRGDGDLATRTMLDNTVMFGLDKLTGGLPAFVNCTRESLTEELVNDKIIPDTNSLHTFTFNNDEMTINGVKQPDNVFKKYKEKYNWHPGRGMSYSRDGIINNN